MTGWIGKEQQIPHVYRLPHLLFAGKGDIHTEFTLHKQVFRSPSYRPQSHIKSSGDALNHLKKGFREFMDPSYEHWIVIDKMDLTDNSSSFVARRLTPSTFVIAEDDKFDAFALMYAKIYTDPPVFVLCDAASNMPSERSKNGKNIPHTSRLFPSTHAPPARYTKIRDFIEQCPVPDNDNQPLNPGGKIPYVLIISHCHFDHLGGSSQFPPNITPTIASAAGKSFVAPGGPLWEHSGCKHEGLPEPDYRPSIWAEHESRLFFKDGEAVALPPGEAGGEGWHDLKITMLQTPGHTPDGLSWFDEVERRIFMGDTLYYTGAGPEPFPGTYPGGILHPVEGSLVAFMQTLEMLRGRSGKGVRMSCAHVNADEDAGEMVANVTEFMHKVLDFRLPIEKIEIDDGVETWSFGVTEDPKTGKELGITAPARLFWEYKTHRC